MDLITLSKNNMKKLITLFLVLCIGFNAWAYDFKSGDLYYNITGDTTVEVTYELLESAYTPDNYAGVTDVIIPEYVVYSGKTYTVTRIGVDAFHKSSDIRSIVIPNTIHTLGMRCLYTGRKLSSITIPAGINAIPPGDQYAGILCINADTIIFKSATPPSIGSLSGTYAISNSVCIVPCGALDAYTTNIAIKETAYKIEEITYSISLKPSNEAFGIAKVIHSDCESAIIMAIPNEGCTFVKWSDGNTQPTRYVELTEDITLTAYFAKEGYTIHVYQDCNTTIE